jgi:hypothetical protein
LAFDTARDPYTARNALGIIAPLVTTVAHLPSAAANKGMRAFVTDATSAVYHSTVAGGGTIAIGVTSDGTNWYVS